MPLKNTGGFSLIQISILLAAGAIILASLLPGGGAGDYNQKMISNVDKLDAVEKAMTSFMLTNGRRPCPASGGYNVNDQYFGVEAATPGTCTGGTPAVQLGPDAGTGYVIAGSIPTKTLNLPDEYAFDAWGRQFTYTVDKRATAAASCYTLQSGGGTGGIVIKNTSSGSVLDNVMVTYISHGTDGHGAFPAGGSTPANRINRGISNKNADGSANAAGVDTLINAGVDASFVYNTTNFTNVRIKRDRVANFDDLVYYRKDTMNVCGIGNSLVLTNPNGFSMQGSSGEGAGTSLAIGDINGDGIDDLVIGAPNATVSGKANAGRVYVVFGTTTPFTAPFNLSSLNGANGFVIEGANAGDKIGSSVAVGDINGDAVKDVIVGAPGFSSSQGAAYVVYGGTGAWSTPFTLGAVPNGTTYFRIDGQAASDLAGTSVAAGDITAHNDGTQDVIVGAPGVTVGGNANSGKTYVIYGIQGDVPPLSSGVYALSTASNTNGTNGFSISGSLGEKSGTSVAAGDVNGDGNADVIIGAPYATPVSGGTYTNAGIVYVVFGNGGIWSAVTLGTLNGSTGVNGSNGFLANGYSVGDHAGTSVAAGDVNGDGISDLIVGAPNAAPQSRSNAGSTYVMFGKNTSWSKSNDLGALTVGAAPKGFSLGGSSGETSGSAVASGCSVNGNGIAPVLIGAPQAGSGSTNCVPNTFPNPTKSNSYVVFGSGNGWIDSQNLCTLDANNGTATYTNGLYAKGLANSDLLGTAMASLDLSKRGKCAVAIGAPGVTIGGNANSGKIYIIYGSGNLAPTFDLSTIQ